MNFFYFSLLDYNRTNLYKYSNKKRRVYKLYSTVEFNNQ